MTHEKKGLVGIEVGLDPVEYAVAQMEARRRGVTADQVATEKFSDRLDAALKRAAAAFCGPKRPESDLN